MAIPQIVLAAVYDGGVQPISIGSAASHLIDAGFAPVCIDTTVEPQRFGELVANATVLAISVPLFQAVAPAAEYATRCRALNPKCTIVMFGQHANIHRERLLSRYCDYVIRGDYEAGLVALVRGADATDLASLGVCARGCSAPVYIHRRPLLPPARSMLPPLSCYRYPELEFLWTRDAPVPLVGNVETARGCHHACSYCSVFAATGRKVALLAQDMIIEDIRQVVQMGAKHIWFTDAEFFNGRHHGLFVIQRMKREFPDLTFDITTRADHILECKDQIRELRDLGCLFVTSALEFPSQVFLDAVDKELRLDQIESAVAYCQQIGLTLNPTFIPFNPWVGYEELNAFRNWLERQRLLEAVNPLQYETRLYLYKGSPLLNHPDVRKLKLTEREFEYEWEHPDTRVEQAWAVVVEPSKVGSFKRCCIKC
jgi:radical SAM superfamily enzyme YgiQ (UPF0313 family)